MSQVWLARGLLLIVFILVGLFLSIPVKNLASQISIYSSGQVEKTGDRTNILLLGIGGEGHDAPDLTDTIILASYSHSKSEITLISIPRDLWLPSLKTKINTTYYYGQRKSPGGGIILSKSAISEVTGVPIHYAAIIDFQTFVQAINLIGGIQVNVGNSFTDERFPIAGKENDTCSGDLSYSCRYEKISFVKGLNDFDGETALKYVRSRHSTDLSTGTDYSRGVRQKEVISGIKAKLISPDIIKNPKTVSELLDLFITKTITDVDKSLYFNFLQMAIASRNSQLKTYTLNDPDHLYHPPVSQTYDNQWVLLPKNNDPKSITNFIESVLN